MEFVGLFVLQVFLLFLLSQELTKSLSMLFYKITKSKTITVHLLALLFFPGVVIHELAHLIVANILFVKTGDIEFVPQVQGGHVKLGSVEIAKTDPLRRFLIGAAPVAVGLFLIGGSFVYLQMLTPDTLWIKILFAYVLFVIGNTMYSSSKDMEGAIELFITLGVVFGIFYFLGFRTPDIDFRNILSPGIIEVVKTIDVFLLIPIAIDTIIIFLAKMLLRR